MALQFSEAWLVSACTWLCLFACSPQAVIAERGDAGSPAPGTLITNSVADFSLVQGEHGWSYGYVQPDNALEFTEMTERTIVDGYSPPSGEDWVTWAVGTGQYWTKLFALGAHPNGAITTQGRVAVNQYAVRRWTSNVEGNLIVSGELAKLDANSASNGSDARVLVDSALLYEQFLNGDDAAGHTYEVQATVLVGSVIDLVLDPHAENDVADLTRFTATISYGEPHP